jgi:hypothetical protein
VGHDKIINQRATDSNITVICHGCQKVAFCNDENQEEVKLCHALQKGDDVPLRHKVGQHLRGNDRGVAEINEGQMTEKIIHWRVKLRTGSD